LPVAAGYALCGFQAERHRGRSLRVVVGIIAFILGATALVMTYSRGPWFAAAVGMFIFIAFCKPKLIPVFLLLGLIALPFIPATVKDRVLSSFNPNDQSIGYRSLLVGSGLKTIADSPVFGVGLGAGVVQAVVLNNYWPSELAYRFTHTHNLFVQVWCETGVFGFVTFFGAVLHNIIMAVRGILEKKPRADTRPAPTSKIFASSLIAGITAMILCGIADNTFSYSRIMLLFWILFGLLLSVRKCDIIKSRED